MNSGKYKLKNFLQDGNLVQIIIPEIQRDYVWQTDNVKKFLQTILDNSKRQNNESKKFTEEFLNTLTPEERNALIQLKKDAAIKSNIGFFYAYLDNKDRYVLIDGQQRMTTLFLLILALSVKEKQADYFRKNYFRNNILKLDYKVREDSHEFMLKFTDYILKGNNIKDIENEYWNFTEYQNDVTIKSIINNYQVISDFIDENDISLDYVENYIEFWYFNISESKQGEELYLYMNSRGETVSPNESIKAGLLKGKEVKEKKEWGAKWEHWQNFFWRNRDRNPNADKGIEEFLKWIKFIEIVKSKKELPKTALEKEIKEIESSKKINSTGLDFLKIESYFNALKRISSIKEIQFNINWLTGNNINTIEYVKFIPVLMYAQKHTEFNIGQIERFSKFFMNITRFEATIARTPHNSLVEVILLTGLFLEKEYTDITDITVFADKYKNILTDEEIAKLSIYRQSSDDLRKEMEDAFWQAEDFKYCNGKISLIWDCIDFDGSDLSAFDKKKLSEFKDCFDNFRALFEKPEDILRRALLTKGDYLVDEGYTKYLEKRRYSFLIKNEEWKEQLTSNDRIKIYKSLIKDFGNRRKADNSAKTEDILNKIITDFLEIKKEKDWIYYFVKYPVLLDCCGDKKICGKDENDVGNIKLLNKTRVKDEKDYTFLKDKIKI